MHDLEQHDEPWRDEIVAEVRRAREQLLAAAGYDLRTLVDRLQQQARASGRIAVTLPRRAPMNEPPT